jgi:prepilin-type N-terminal cleavage/methylation domain-containing protein
MTEGHPNKAFTLIEMMVVLGIIAVLASLVVTLTLRVDNQSKERALDNVFGLLGTSLREYYEVRDKFPEQPARDAHAFALDHIEWMVQELRSVPDSRAVLEQLNSATVKSLAGDPDIPEIRDPWGTVLDYVYEYADGKGDTFPELISAGPDKVFGTEDDVSSKAR